MHSIDLYHAIADANRRTILDLLQSRGPLRAGEIVASLSHISQPAVSKHLRVLREANLVQDVQEGRERWYHLNPAPLQQIVQWLAHYDAVWEERLNTLKQVAEEGND
jgi:DNA-binding transcriptional ArsR family regulator